MTDIYDDKKAGYFAAERKEMLSFVDQAARLILDIGCADGSFGAQIKERQSCHITGVELTDEAAMLASSRLDKVLVGDFLSEQVFAHLGSGYDCVVLNDVLEHLIDPWMALGRIRSLLKPGGSVVASVPNLRYFRVLKSLVQDGDFTYVDKGVLDKTHLRFFTKKTIPALFQPSGLQIEKLVGINGPKRLPPKYALLTWLGGGKHTDIRWLQFAVVARNPA